MLFPQESRRYCTFLASNTYKIVTDADMVIGKKSNEQAEAAIQSGEFFLMSAFNISDEVPPSSVALERAARSPVPENTTYLLSIAGRGGYPEWRVFLYAAG